MSFTNAYSTRFANMTNYLEDQLQDIAVQVGAVPTYTQPILAGMMMPAVIQQHASATDTALPRNVIIEKQTYRHGKLESVVEKCLDDEYLAHSVVLSVISVLVFYPAIYFLNKQRHHKIGPRMFDQMMYYALMLITFAHFMSEQKSLAQYTFIPLPNWHKLMNVFLLIEQCSLVLFLGNLSGTLTNDVEATLFGVNLILILILQEKDSVKGEIKWSVLPLIVNNSYMVYTNFKSYFWKEDSSTMATIPSSPSSCPSQAQQQMRPLVHKQKVYWALVWYGGSLCGYAMMQVHGQGLQILTNRDMFLFTASETVFMVSMAMCYFYSWQTYAVEVAADRVDVPNKDIIVAVPIVEVVNQAGRFALELVDAVLKTAICAKIAQILAPVTSMLDRASGRTKPEPKGYAQLNSEDEFGESQMSTFKDQDVQNLDGMSALDNMHSPCSSKSNSPQQPQSDVEMTYGQPDADHEGQGPTSSFDSNHRTNQRSARVPLNSGQMSPIDELSVETDESSRVGYPNSIQYPITHFGLVTDNASAKSGNSRNFQMPEKDFIMEITRQRDQMFTANKTDDGKTSHM